MRKALVYSKKLERVGLTRQQAEVHLEILEEIVEDEMATKADIQSLKSEMRQMEYKITIKFGLMLAAAVGILAALQKYS